MTNLTKREEAFEAKFANDEDMKFKLLARRNKLLGLWVAAQTGVADAEAYAMSVVESDLQKAGHGDVLEKVRADLAAAGADVSDADILNKMDEFLIEAQAQI